MTGVRPRSPLRYRIASISGAVLLCATANPAPGTSGVATEGGGVGLHLDVVFRDYSPLSRSTELVQRLLTPLTALRVIDAARASQSLKEQAIDLADERFSYYVPLDAPPETGYALLVFVPPWSSAAVPSQWIPTLNRHAMIFVSAANSGNEANVLDRREPLALLAFQNIMNRYHVDRGQVFIGGFSGGSRVAMRLALGYADVFHGVLLIAGSDPMGTADEPVPGQSLLRELQESTRIVYSTGEHDTFHADEDSLSRKSLEAWCIFNSKTVAARWQGHEVPDTASFERAVGGLFTPRPVDSKTLETCRARNAKSVESGLDDAEHLLASGKWDQGRRLLEKIDARYAGLAAPRSVALAGKLSTALR